LRLAIRSLLCVGDEQPEQLLLERAAWHSVLLVSAELCHNRIRNGGILVEVCLQRLDRLAGAVTRPLPVHTFLLVFASGVVKDLPKRVSRGSSQPTTTA
jgi:hypothetical protein